MSELTSAPSGAPIASGDLFAMRKAGSAGLTQVTSDDIAAFTGGGSGGGWSKASSTAISGASTIIALPSATIIKVFLRDIVMSNSNRPRIALRSSSADVTFDYVTFLSNGSSSVATSVAEIIIGGVNTTGNSYGILDIFNAITGTEKTDIATKSWGGNAVVLRDAVAPASVINELRIFGSGGTISSGTVDIFSNA